MSNIELAEPLNPHEAAQKLRLLLAHVQQQFPTTALPTATPDRGRKKLTIGMATYDDYDGVYFTVQALRVYHPEVQDEIEILVVDNHPEGVASHQLKALENWIPNYRYLPYRAWCGTAVRDLVFRESNASYVLCLDAHVLVVPGAIRKLLDYFNAHSDTKDMLQGPLLNDDLQTMSTHLEPTWRGAMYGIWATDERGRNPDGAPFEIPMHGLGLFACRRDAWPGFNPKLRGFGGEEGYIHEKIRRSGGRILCLPFLRWLHRFNRPSGVPYQLTHEDRVRNYLLTLRELGHAETDFEAHFRDYLGAPAADQLLARARAELDNPLCHFDAIYCLNHDDDAERWEAMTQQFAGLGMGWMVRRFSAVKMPDNHYLGCALSHRRLIEEAKKHRLSHVLVIEDDVHFCAEALDSLSCAFQELDQRRWDVLYLGGQPWGIPFPLAPHCQYLERPLAPAYTHAVAYHQTFYDRILADLPANEEAMAGWIAEYHTLEQYLVQFAATSFVTRPVFVRHQNG